MSVMGTAARRLARVARGRSARASSWAMVGQLASLVASAANFLLLARLIGPAEYGLVAGTWALVMAVGPLASLGSERLLVRDVSGRQLPAAQALGAGLLTLSAGAFMVIGGLVGLHSVLLPQTPVLLLAALAVAEIPAAGVIKLITGLCFSTGNARAAAVTSVLVSLTKLLAVATFALLGGDEAVTWAVLYAGFSLVSALGQLLWAARRFGRPSARNYHFFRRARDGAPFSGHVIAGIAQNDADKTLLVRYGLAAEAGLYSVAYRLISMAFMPVLAVLQAMFPRYFAVGSAGGLTATSALARRLALPLLAYAVGATVLLVAITPVLPVLLGEEYRESSRFLLLLAPLVLFKVVQTVTGDALTGAGMQTTRTLCVATAAGVNIAVNIALIPVLGVMGAIIATYVAEVTQVVLVLVAVRRGLGRARAAAQEEPVPA
jgi:O-antigen/teichoic acid export membrane protein